VVEHGGKTTVARHLDHTFEKARVGALRNVVVGGDTFVCSGDDTYRHL
jgi:hypothetical protein